MTPAPVQCGIPVGTDRRPAFSGGKDRLVKRPRISHVGGGLLLVALIAVLAAGCGDDSTSGSATTGAVTVDETIAAAVPAAIKSKGTLTIASDGTYPPNEFIGADGKTVEGMDPDLAKALGEVMGLKVKVVVTTFDGIIPGLAAGKYDLGMSSFTDTKEREKVVDFVTYFEAGTAFYVKTDGGPDDQRARRPLRSHGRRRAGDDAGRRRHRAEREVQEGGQAGRDRPRLPGSERREPRPLERPGRGRNGRLACRRRTSSSSPTASSSSPASPTGRSPTASRFPRGTAWPSRSSMRSRS